LGGRRRVVDTSLSSAVIGEGPARVRNCAGQDWPDDCLRAKLCWSLGLAIE